MEFIIMARNQSEFENFINMFLDIKQLKDAGARMRYIPVDGEYYIGSEEVLHLDKSVTLKSLSIENVRSCLAMGGFGKVNFTINQADKELTDDDVTRLMQVLKDAGIEDRVTYMDLSGNLFTKELDFSAYTNLHKKPSLRCIY